LKSNKKTAFKDSKWMTWELLKSSPRAKVRKFVSYYKKKSRRVDGSSDEMRRRGLSEGRRNLITASRHSLKWTDGGLSVSGCSHSARKPSVYFMHSAGLSIATPFPLCLVLNYERGCAPFPSLFQHLAFYVDSLKISTPVRSPLLSRQLELLPKFNWERVHKKQQIFQNKHFASCSCIAIVTWIQIYNIFIKEIAI